jgi:hypothetical protein
MILHICELANMFFFIHIQVKEKSYYTFVGFRVISFIHIGGEENDIAHL